MRVATSAIIALFAVAAAPALAATPAASVPSPLQIADAGDFTGQRADYEARARRAMDLWQRRMSDAGVKAQEGLDRAWRATKEQWAELQQASAESWDRSRAAFERASARLKEAWHKYQPDDR